MTLFKQVAFVVSLVLLLIVVATTVGDFQRSGSFVEGQLQTTAQDMATTLGIAISNSATMADQAAYETLFNAVFDSGYYSSIELVAPDGSLIHRKDRLMEIEGVPEWFVSIMPFWPATGTTEVMQGWVPLGTLRLTLHPGYVYSSLYQNLEASLVWFLILFSSGLIFLWLLLHQLLKPLAQVKQQAEAIHRNEFVQQKTLPRTLELRSVVEAMNRMVEKVHRVFEDQEKNLARYQKLLYEDSLTGLGNREYFISELVRAQSEETSFQGSMAVIKIYNLDYIRDNYGYEKSDLVVTTLADILKEDCGHHTNEQCARLTGSEFAMLMPEGTQTADAHLHEIFEKFKCSEKLQDFQENISLTAGITSVHVGGSVGETLAESDFALTQAETAGPYTVNENLTSNITLPQGKMQWRSWFEQCISENKLFLVKQKVIDAEGHIIHHEIFVRLKNDDGQTVPAGMFMPMASALGLGETIDRTVFKLVKDLRGKPGEAVALNLTVSVFSHADALVEFNQLLHYFQHSGTALSVEASHTILLRYPAMCAEVAESVRKAGHSFGIDNLNIGSSLQGLHIVRPDYVKVNAKTLYDMSSGDLPAGYQALRTLTNTLDIRLIAVGVDSQELHDRLRELGVGTMQGNLLGEAEDFL